MAFDFVAYNELRVSIIFSVITVMQKWDSGNEDADKARLEKIIKECDKSNIGKCFKKVPEHRKHHLELLLLSIKLLDAELAESNTRKLLDGDQSIPDTRPQARILNSLAYYIYMQIKEESTTALFNYAIFDSSDNSSLARSLAAGLLLSKENVPEPKHLVHMYKALSNFFRAHTYVNSEVTLGYRPVPAFNKIEQDITKTTQRFLALDEKLRDKLQAEYEMSAMAMPVTEPGPKGS